MAPIETNNEKFLMEVILASDVGGSSTNWNDVMAGTGMKSEKGCRNKLAALKKDYAASKRAAVPAVATPAKAATTTPKKTTKRKAKEEEEDDDDEEGDDTPKATKTPKSAKGNKKAKVADIEDFDMEDAGNVDI